MPLPLIPVLLAGSAFIILRNRGSSSSLSKIDAPAPKQGQIPLTSPQPGPSIDDEQSKQIWKNIQSALKYISELSVQTPTGEHFFCPDCDPGAVDGVPGKNTKSAIAAFQELMDLPITGDWGGDEIEALGIVLASQDAGEWIPCDPDSYFPPEHISCVETPDGSHVIYPSAALDDGSVKDQGVIADSIPDRPPIAADSSCQYILYQDDSFFDEQNALIIYWATMKRDGFIDHSNSYLADMVHLEMMSRYLHTCKMLGKENVGDGVSQWWDTNLASVFNKFKVYELMPSQLDDDAAALQTKVS